MKTKMLFILFCITLCCSQLAWAQPNQWLMVTTPFDGEESCSQDYETFPDKYIKEKYAQREYITHIAYSTDGWTVVTRKGQYKKQKYIRSKELPEQFIEKGWNEGLDITSAIYAQGTWVIVMSDANLNTQTWFTSYDKESLKKDIQKYWKTHSIHIVAGTGDGGWFVVMSNGLGHYNQTYIFDAKLPTNFIKTHQGQGKNITVAAYSNNEWMLVMSMTPHKKTDTYHFGAWNENYLNKAYNGDRGISVLAYSSTENSNEDEIEEYMAQAEEAAGNEDYDVAIELYNAIIAIQPNNADAYAGLSFCKYSLERYKASLNDAKKALTYDKNHELALQMSALGKWTLGENAAALVDLNTLITKYPKEAVYWEQRGMLNEEMKNFSAAISDYTKALALDNTSTEAKEGLARLKSNNKVVAKPTITWDMPTTASTTVTKAIYEIKACISAANQVVSKIKILLNGKEINYNFNSRGLTVEDDCLVNLSQSLTLQNGANTVQIVVTTTAHTVSSEIRTINYKGQQNNNNNNQQNNNNNNNNNNNTLAGNYHALLIGISQYDDLSIKNLDRPVQDVQTLKQLLTSQYTFKSNDVHVLANPTKDEILNKLTELQERLTSKDNLLIFYAGHGIVKNNVGYWLPSDATNASRSKWFSNAELKDYINAFKAQHVLVVADACFSGALITGGYRDMNLFACEQMEKVPSRRAMTSGANTVVPDNSVFFDYFVKRLKENTASCFTAEDLYSKIKPAVINNSPNQQIPQFGALPQSGDEGGNFIFKKK